MNADSIQTTIATVAMSVPDCAAALSCSKSHIWALIKSGQIRTLRLGARRLIPSSELARILGEAK